MKSEVPPIERMALGLILRHRSTDIVDVIRGLAGGDVLMWMALGFVFACVAFFALYETVTGRPYVKSRRERREALRRRRKVLWEYERRPRADDAEPD